MEVYEPLPQPIVSKFGQEIAMHIQQRLHYQWKLVHRFAKTALPLSHKTSRDFVQLCNTYGADLPSYATRRLCPWCSVIQLPALTCSIKLQKRTRRSQANIGQHKKIKNEVVHRCLSCDRVSLREPGAPRAGGKLQSSSAAAAAATGKPHSTDINNYNNSNGTSSSGSKKKQSGEVNSNKAPKFSFLATLDRRMSASSSASVCNSSGSSGSKRKEPADFMAFSSSSGTTYTPKKPSNSGVVNLLELEASNKKKRRKSLSSQSTVNDQQSAPVASSLGSLQRMLLQKR